MPLRAASGGPRRRGRRHVRRVLARRRKRRVLLFRPRRRGEDPAGRGHAPSRARHRGASSRAARLGGAPRAPRLAPRHPRAPVPRRAARAPRLAARARTPARRSCCCRRGRRRRRRSPTDARGEVREVADHRAHAVRRRAAERSRVVGGARLGDDVGCGGAGPEPARLGGAPPRRQPRWPLGGGLAQSAHAARSPRRSGHCADGGGHDELHQRRRRLPRQLGEGAGGESAFGARGRHQGLLIPRVRAAGGAVAGRLCVGRGRHAVQPERQRRCDGRVLGDDTGQQRIEGRQFLSRRRPLPRIWP